LGPARYLVVAVSPRRTVVVFIFTESRVMHATAHFSPPSNTRRRLLLTMMSLAMVGTALPLAAHEPAPTGLRLVIDYGDGVQTHFTNLKWRSGMAVLDALAAAQAHSHGVTHATKGSGETAMVTKIGDLKNEGAGKNWIFYVNSKPGEASAAVSAVKAGDVILWKFERYDYNSKP
jgi:hypothetical protein